MNGTVGFGSGGYLNVAGQPANAGLTIGTVRLGSAGGGSFGSSMVGAVSLSSGNSAAYPGGGGGGGGGAVNANGANGADGLVIIEW